MVRYVLMLTQASLIDYFGVEPMPYFFFVLVTFLAAVGAFVATFLGAAVFLAATGATDFLAATGAAFFAVALFFTGFAVFFSDFAEVLPAEAFPVLPPKMESQLDAYFSFVPTRVIVTKSPFKNVQRADSMRASISINVTDTFRFGQYNFKSFE